MTPQRIIGFCLSILATSAGVAAQQRSDTTNPPATATSVTTVTYPAGGVMPFRRVERRTESGARKVIIERVEAPSEGRWEPLAETVTDTTRTGNTNTRTQQDVFWFDLQHQRTLTQTTQSEQETQPDASTRTVERTWVADSDGRLTLSSGYVEETRSTSPGIRQSDATLLLRSPEGPLYEVERSESTEHQVSSAVVRYDSTDFVRDINGRWLPTEAHSGQASGIGSAERVEEETIQRQNLSGALVLRDKVVTRTSESNGENRVVIETYSQDAEGFVRSDSHLALQQRVRTSTTVTPDGGRTTVEDTEARNPLAPSDPMRVIRRTLETVRSVAPGRWLTVRQTFERDPNSRLVLVTNESEESTAK